MNNRRTNKTSVRTLFHSSVEPLRDSRRARTLNAPQNVWKPSVCVLFLLAVLYLLVARPRLAPLEETPTALPLLSKYFSSRYFSHSRTRGQPKIAIYTIAIGSFATDDFYPLLRGLQVEYASRHGYDLHIQTRRISYQTINAHWEKIPGTQLLLQHGRTPATNEPYDFVFWMDADVVISNMSVRIEDIWDQVPTAQKSNVHIVLSGDAQLVVNFGQVLWKNCHQTMERLQTTWDMYNVRLWRVPFREQGMFAVMLAGCKPSDSDQQKKACYNGLLYQEGWKGDFVRKAVIEANLTEIYKHVAPWTRQSVYWVPQTTVNSYQDSFHLGHFLFHAAGDQKQFLNGHIATSLEQNQLEKAKILKLGDFHEWPH